MTQPHYVVTGAGTGIGRAIALRLATDGAGLTLMARGVERLEQTADAVVESGSARPGVVPCDVTDAASVDAAFATAAAQGGPLQGIVANAGVGGPNFAGDDDRWAEVIDTNLTGTYRCLRAAQHHLAIGQGTCHMVVIASILGRIGVPGYTAYCASKTGLLGLTRALAHELVRRDVQVNAICPGWVDTAMAREGIEGMATAMGVDYEEALNVAMKAVPVGRMSKPAHIAGVVAWLLSDDARGMVGQSIDMNGGAFMI